MIGLSAKKVVHRDLALRNIMVSYGNERDRFVAKVGDMGLALDTRKDEESNETALPIKWAAPECYLNKEFSSASDVWSFGVVLFELFSYAETPYKGMTNRQVLEQVPQGLRLERPENCPERIYSLMCKCWEIGEKRCLCKCLFLEPAKRPSFIQIFEELEQIEKESKTAATFAPPVTKKGETIDDEEVIYNDVEMQVYN